MNRLSGKVAFVTGAGRGIGAAIAHAFAAEGAAVVLAELDGETARATAREIARQHGDAVQVLAHETDVTQPDSVRAAWVDAFFATGASQCGFCSPGIIVRLAGTSGPPCSSVCRSLPSMRRMST